MGIDGWFAQRTTSNSKTTFEDAMSLVGIVESK